MKQFISLNKIKEIGENAGFTQLVQIIKTKVGIIEFNVCPKYELNSSHTARRTGTTLMFKDNIPALAIMKFTRHKTDSSFMKYTMINKEENTRLLENHHYFNS